MFYIVKTPQQGLRFPGDRADYAFYLACREHSLPVQLEFALCHAFLLQSRDPVKSAARVIAFPLRPCQNVTDSGDHFLVVIRKPDDLHVFLTGGSDCFHRIAIVRQVGSVILAHKRVHLPDGLQRLFDLLIFRIV